MVNMVDAKAVIKPRMYIMRELITNGKAAQQKGIKVNDICQCHNSLRLLFAEKSGI